MKIIKFLKSTLAIPIAFSFIGFTQANGANCDTFPDLFRTTTRDGFSICKTEKLKTSVRSECFTFFAETETSADQTMNKLLSTFKNQLDPSCQTSCYIYGANTKHVDCQMQQFFF